MAGIVFREPDDGDAALILRWRQSERVARRMSSRFEGDLESQRRWLEACRSRTDYHHWIVEAGGRPAGFISVARLDLAAGATSWGYYLGDEAALGLGGLVPPYLYNWLFFDLRLFRIEAEVRADNEEVVDLHRFHGYRREAAPAGAAPGHVHLVLERAAWAARTRLHRLRADFPWSDPPPELRARLDAAREVAGV